MADEKETMMELVKKQNGLLETQNKLLIKNNETQEKLADGFLVLAHSLMNVHDAITVLDVVQDIATCVENIDQSTEALYQFAAGDDAFMEEGGIYADQNEDTPQTD